jgi:hypothetical protein
MFCGECGRKVTQVVPLPELVEPPAPEPTVAIEIPRVRPEPLPAFLEAPEVVEQAETELEDDVERTILAPRRRAAWTLTGPDGVAHPIRAATMIGRAPQRPASRPELALLALVDETKSLSKSHAILEPDGESLTVEDIGSTNGILLIGPDGAETEFPVGRPVPVEPGAVLEFGDYVATFDRRDPRSAS